MKVRLKPSGKRGKRILRESPPSTLKQVVIALLSDPEIETVKEILRKQRTQVKRQLD